MTFEKLSDDRVLITLRDDDLRDLGLDFDNAAPLTSEHRQKLRKILLLACLDTGISAKGRRFLLEALPMKTGCLLILWAQRVHTRKKYRIKTAQEYPVCFFETENDLIDAVIRLHSLISLPGCSLYRYRGKYCLIFFCRTLDKKVGRLLCEYGRLRQTGAVAVAKIKEHGCLLGKNALTDAYSEDTPRLSSVSSASSSAI